MTEIILFAAILFIFGWIQVAQLASFMAAQPTAIVLYKLPGTVAGTPTEDHTGRSTTGAQHDGSPTSTPSLQTTTASLTSAAPATYTPQEPTTTTQDANADLDEVGGVSTSPPVDQPQSPGNQGSNGTGLGGGGGGSGTGAGDTNGRPAGGKPEASGAGKTSAIPELGMFLYSVFIVYVSTVKLVYHNVSLIKRNMTEPGMLMIFGIIWELVVRQLSVNKDASPRFNSRIFFYLFLPSTVLESASLLSNKWLFLNLLPILAHSILGTLIYASALGFTIYSLSLHNAFNPRVVQLQSSIQLPLAQASIAFHEITNLTQTTNTSEPNWIQPIEGRANQHRALLEQGKSYTSVQASGAFVELDNLTLADCLVFGTILSSVDSTTMLGIFRLFQMNDKLYYLVLGESLMNNAVVLVIFNLLLDLFNETRLTVVKIYFAIMQFFLTLFSSIFIGLSLAGVALLAIRLTKRFQVPSALTSYQNQCQAMVETLLILKLAYLTYTLASMAGTSSIVSLATFGILQDQYIKHNLNLRSQVTFRQVILATKTMGFSLVYPLLGMLLVEVANTNQFFQTWLAADLDQISITSSTVGSTSPANGVLPLTGSVQTGNADRPMNLPGSEASSAVGKLTKLADHSHLYWNFKFLAIVTLVTVAYRFVVVMFMSSLCNLFTSRQLRIRFSEQVLMAYGGLKGPLAFALVHRLIEHEEYRDRIMRNKHLFMYTILFITFLSSLLKGSLIRPLVAKVQLNLTHSLPSPISYSSIVFDEVNSKVTEYISHGLNSIIGHTKSPYDRFVEFNETALKPWLSREGVNTNWLSVFYDHLILDETLNATCFHRSIEDPTMQFCWHLNASARENHHRDYNAQRLEIYNRRVSGQSQILHTIDEDELAQVNRLQSRVNNQLSELVLPDHRGRVKRPARIKHHLNPQMGADRDGSPLREFVMFDLKLDEAKRRKMSARVEPIRMLSTTTNSLDDEPNSRQPNVRRRDPGRASRSTRSPNLELATKRLHLVEIERRLAAENASLIESDPSRVPTTIVDTRAVPESNVASNHSRLPIATNVNIDQSELRRMRHHRPDTHITRRQRARRRPSQRVGPPDQRAPERRFTHRIDNEP